MTNKTEPTNAGGKKGETVYSGQYVEMVERCGSWLMAYPREVPETGEGDYLLRMLDELRGIYDKVVEGGGYVGVNVAASVKLGGLTYWVDVTGKGGDVQMRPEIVDYQKFKQIIEGADKVKMEAADGDAGVYRGYWSVVVEDKGDLRAYARWGEGMQKLRRKPRELMESVTLEAMNNFERLTKERANKVVEVRGLIRLGGIGHRPLVLGWDAATLEPVRGDYVDLVKAADAVTFSRPWPEC